MEYSSVDNGDSNDDKHGPEYTKAPVMKTFSKKY